MGWVNAENLIRAARVREKLSRTERQIEQGKVKLDAIIQGGAPGSSREAVQTKITIAQIEARLSQPEPAMHDAQRTEGGYKFGNGRKGTARSSAQRTYRKHY